jgi:hypothetical protein
MGDVSHAGCQQTYSKPVHVEFLTPENFSDDLVVGPPFPCPDLLVAPGGALCILSATAEQKQIFPDAHGGAVVRSVHWTSPTTLATAGAATIRLWDTTRVPCSTF